MQSLMESRYLLLRLCATHLPLLARSLSSKVSCFLHLSHLPEDDTHVRRTISSENEFTCDFASFNISIKQLISKLLQFARNDSEIKRSKQKSTQKTAPPSGRHSYPPVLCLQLL